VGAHRRRIGSVMGSTARFKSSVNINNNNGGVSGRRPSLLTRCPSAILNSSGGGGGGSGSDNDVSGASGVGENASTTSTPMTKNMMSTSLNSSQRGNSRFSVMSTTSRSSVMSLSLSRGSVMSRSSVISNTSTGSFTNGNGNGNGGGNGIGIGRRVIRRSSRIQGSSGGGGGGGGGGRRARARNGSIAMSPSLSAAHAASGDGIVTRASLAGKGTGRIMQPRASIFQHVAKGKHIVGSASALVTFICVLCILRTQISRSINMQLCTLQCK
jgi:hypothetical protein